MSWAALLATSCASEVTPETSESFAASLASALHAACPPAAPDDGAARERCADQLGDLPVLRSHMTSTFRWGGQTEGAGYDPTRSNTTRFNPFVWRRMYLSTFMFDGQHRVEEDGPRSVVHVNIAFRGQLDPGDYPYPFWHAEKKWRSYEAARELLFILEEGKVVGVLRSAEQEAERPHVARTWDQSWSWTSPRGAEPQNALYANLLSANNPHRSALEEAYRAFSEAQRQSECTSCHSPNNTNAQNPLELFNYPNQALTGRHAIVAELEQNTMPPANTDAGTGVGIGDTPYRQQLLTLARAFAEAGDRALVFEGEPASL